MRSFHKIDLIGIHTDILSKFGNKFFSSYADVFMRDCNDNIYLYFYAENIKDVIEIDNENHAVILHLPTKEGVVVKYNNEYTEEVSIRKVNKPQGVLLCSFEDAFDFYDKTNYGDIVEIIYKWMKDLYPYDYDEELESFMNKFKLD